MDPLAKILLVFGGVLMASRLRLPLGLALAGGGVLLELWSGRPPAVVTADVLTAASRPELWLLVVNIVLIMEIGAYMSSGANALALINAARRWGGRHGRALGMVAIPAAIGLVPMPGGALLSAPLVGETAKGSQRSPEWQAAVNYWFRHILEFWWPLYPVVIVTLSIYPIETWQFMAMQAPFTLISIGAGVVFLLRPHLAELAGQGEGEKAGSGAVGRVLAPVAVVVTLTLLLPPMLRQWFAGMEGGLAKMLAMLAGLAVGLVLVVTAPGGKAGLFANLWSRKTGNVVLTLVGVMVFQSLLASSGLLPQAGSRLAASRVPLAVIIALLPLVAGLVTGIAIGFAGAAFPLVAGLLVAPGHAGPPPMAALMLAFSMGYVGMMLSPVHLCFVLTKQYFQAPFPAIYRFLVPCVATVAVCGGALAWLLWSRGW